MKAFLFVLGLLTLTACSDREKSTQTKTNSPVEARVDSSATQPIRSLSEKTALKNNLPVGAGTWHYEKTTDNAGRLIYKASTIAPDLIEFDFPYAGGSTATLTIRKRDADTHVYIQVSKGQFNRSYQGGEARVRFDENPPVAYPFSAAENGSANVIFFDSDKVLINRMKAARKMVVDVDFAGQGKRQVEFRTAGLSWNH